MARFWKYAASTSAIALMAGCAGSSTWDIDGVRNLPSTGNAFQKAAHMAYVEQAQLEVTEVDWPNASLHLDKARSSAGGVTVMPDDFNNRNIPADARPDLEAARAQLMAALDGGARESQPKEAANCQAIFDCWMEEQHEGHQPKDIKFCRDAFETCIAGLNGTPQRVGGPYFIYFGFNSDQLDAEAMKVVAQIQGDHNNVPASQMTVKAYTDTSGNADYNKALSDRRAAAVRAALQARGITDATVKEEGHGEAELEVQTGDNVKERRNRRAVVYLVK